MANGWRRYQQASDKGTKIIFIDAYICNIEKVNKQIKNDFSYSILQKKCIYTDC